MNFTEISPLLRELLMCHELLVRLGCPAESLYVHSSSGQDDSVQMVAILPGNIRFAVQVGKRPGTWEEMAKDWEEVCDVFNRGIIPEEVILDWWAWSVVVERAAEIALGLGISKKMSDRATTSPISSEQN